MNRSVCRHLLEIELKCQRRRLEECMETDRMVSWISFVIIKTEISTISSAGVTGAECI